MAKRKSRPVASENRLFLLAFGLLVGFVIAFVFLLSRLPVDNIISQYNNDENRGVEVETMNFDYYAVLQAQKAARKPTAQTAVVEPPVVFMEPPTVSRVPQPPNVPQPQAAQPRVDKPAVQQAQPQPRIQERLVQPRIQPAPAQPQRPIQPVPAQPRPQPYAQPAPETRRAPVREIMASDASQDSFYIEAGNYPDNNVAVQVQSALRSLGVEAFIVVRQDSRGNFGHRVRIGPFIEQKRLDATRATLRASGISPKLIRVKG